MSDDIVDRLRGFYSQGPFGKRDFSPYVPPICNEAADEITQLREQLAKAREQYEELLYGVSRKLPDETRHETALRYILQAEKQDNTPCKATETDN